MINSLSFKRMNTKNFSFKNNSNNKKEEKENPITTKGERAILLKTTTCTAIVAGLQFLKEMILDDDKNSLFKNWSKIIAEKIIEKKEKKLGAELTKKDKDLIKTKSFAGLGLAVFGSIALLHMIKKAPFINYQGKVNAFVKKKEMDVYIKTNRAETELYEQMNKKAINANEEEKEQLREQYTKMRIAKNTTPIFVEQK